MTDIAQVGISVDTKDVKVAAGELDRLAKSADKAGDEVEQLGNDATKAGKKVNDGLGKPAKGAGDALGGYAKGAGKAGKSTGRLGQLAGQAGFQVQDFAVQVQGGQSALLAFSQQGSQLLGAFGAGGAIAGAVLAVGAAVGGVLYKQLNKGSEAVKRYQVTIDDLRDSLDGLTEAQLKVGKTVTKKTLKELNREVESLTGRLASTSNSGGVRSKERSKTLSKELIKLTAELDEKTNAQKELEQDILDTKILQKNVIDGIADKQGVILDAERKGLEMQFAFAAKQQLEKDQLDAMAVAKEESNDKEAKALAKQLRDLERIREKNAQINDMLDLRFEREEAQKLEDNNDFLSGILNKNKSEIEVLEGHLATVKALENTFFADQVMQKEALAVLEGQIEEKKTAKALEEAQKRREMISEGFNDARDIMQAFTDFSLIDSVGRKANLEDELRTNKSLSAEQVKNKEKELKGIFEQEKSARKTSIVMNTAAGVMGQLVTGNWVGAAKVGAAGALNYAKVAATTFKSPAPAPSATSSDSGGGQAQAGANITFDFQNVPSGSMVSGEGLVEMMKESLRDARRNGEII